MQLRYVLPKLQKFLTAYTAEREAVEAAEAAIPEPVEPIEEPDATEPFPGGEVAPDPGTGTVAPPNTEPGAEEHAFGATPGQHREHGWQHGRGKGTDPGSTDPGTEQPPVTE